MPKNPTFFAGMYRALDYAYGVVSGIPGLQVDQPASTSGSTQTLNLAFGTVTLGDGTVIAPLNTNAPITIGTGANADSVTPSAVSDPTPGVYQSVSLTATTFSHAHGTGDLVASGTVGLQEALNAAGSAGGGTVIVDAEWVKNGGTQAMLVACVLPANVGLWDNRYGADYGAYTYTLTSTQILAFPTTSVELLPPPGTNSYWQALNANLISLGGGTAYTGGSALTIGYGSTVPTNALSGTIAAAILTTGTAVEVIEVGSGLTSLTAGTAVLNKGLYINSATTAFAAGTGSLQIVMNVANITT